MLIDHKFSVFIKPMKIRLRGGAQVSEGRVEIKHRDSWGTICDDHWSLTEANVVCRSLGYGSAAVTARNSYYGKGSGRVSNQLCLNFVSLRRQLWPRLTGF